MNLTLDEPPRHVGTGLFEGGLRLRGYDQFLMDCAANGLADERLVIALDGLVGGGIQPGACADLLCTWGHSSGTDALVGMALILYDPAIGT